MQRRSDRSLSGVAVARDRGEGYGVRFVDTNGATPALEFSYGFRVRPFFSKLIEPVEQRVAWLDGQKLGRQFVATLAEYL